MEGKTLKSSSALTSAVHDHEPLNDDRQDQLLDEALEESFPASDPPSAARID